MNGYDVNLVEEPNVPLNTECPICQLILRTPRETTCCHIFFCKNCIEEYQTRGNVECPHCREKLGVREAPARERLIKQLKVYCKHQDKGCKWEGELGELEKHLNENPSTDNMDTGCDFTDVECPVCHDPVQRANLSLHKCPNEEIQCNHYIMGCGWRGQRRKLLEHLNMEPHLDQRFEGCGYVELSCIHECDSVKQRRQLQQHEAECFQQAVKNKVARLRNEHSAQLRSLSDDLQVLGSRVQNIQENFGNQLNLQTKNHQCSIELLKSKHTKFLKMCICILIMILVAICLCNSLPKHFENEDVVSHPSPSSDIGGDTAYCPSHESEDVVAGHPSPSPEIAKTGNPVPFEKIVDPYSLLPSLPASFFITDYSKLLARKIKTGSFAAKIGRNILNFTASVLIRDGSPTLVMCFTETGYSKSLLVYVQLVNQEVVTHSHHFNRFSYMPSKYNCFIVVNNVEQHFIQDDRLHVRILNVEIDFNKNPPFSFVLWQYRDFKSANMVWRSRNFYSSLGGFGFYMKLHLDGDGDGLGTHLSFFIHTVTGESDSKSFKGSIKVLFRTFRHFKDKEHTLHFNGEDKPVGVTQFLSHYDVHNYLIHYDCIFFEILDIQISAACCTSH